jgi:proliferating cell nuclear antigen PCNA
MFQGKLDSVRPLKKIFDSLRGLVVDMKVIVRYEGMIFFGLDDKRTALFKLFLERKKFISYDLECPLVFRLKLLHVTKILPLATNEANIEFIIEEGAPHFTILCKNKRSKRTTKFDIRLQPENDEEELPGDVEYKNQLTMGAFFFAKLAKQMKEIHDVVTITVDEEKVKFDVHGDTSSGTVNVMINTDTADHFVPGPEYDPVQDQLPNAKYIGEPVSSLTFSTRFLHVFARPASLAQIVRLKLSPDLPL